MPRFELIHRSPILRRQVDHLRVTVSSRVTGTNTHSGQGPGRQLGRELRKLRETAGLTQSEAAELLDCGQAKINKMEYSILRVSSDDLEKLLVIYKVAPDRAESLRVLAKEQPARRSADTPTTWRAYEEMTDRELDARAIFSWHCERIPVLLRSEPYMLCGVRNYPGSSERVIELLRRRRARTKALFADGPLDYQAILSESALLRMPGGYSPELVVEQMEHLINLARTSNRLVLRILPFSAPLDFVNTDFVVMRFPPGIDEKDFAYIEYVSGAKNITTPSEVDSFENHWNQLRDVALNPTDSLEFVAAVANRARTNPSSMSETL
jgi:transcriptional regulator with XRE-family HTH domain